MKTEGAGQHGIKQTAARSHSDRKPLPSGDSPQSQKKHAPVMFRAQGLVDSFRAVSTSKLATSQEVCKKMPLTITRESTALEKPVNTHVTVLQHLALRVKNRSAQEFISETIQLLENEHRSSFFDRDAPPGPHTAGQAHLRLKILENAFHTKESSWRFFPSAAKVGDEPYSLLLAVQYPLSSILPATCLCSVLSLQKGNSYLIVWNQSKPELPAELVCMAGVQDSKRVPSSEILNALFGKPIRHTAIFDSGNRDSLSAMISAFEGSFPDVYC